jgi:hypothetical protein
MAFWKRHRLKSMLEECANRHLNLSRSFLKAISIAFSRAVGKLSRFWSNFLQSDLDSNYVVWQHNHFNHLFIHSAIDSKTMTIIKDKTQGFTMTSHALHFAVDKQFNLNFPSSIPFGEIDISSGKDKFHILVRLLRDLEVICPCKTGIFQHTFNLSLSCSIITSQIPKLFSCVRCRSDIVKQAITYFNQPHDHSWILLLPLSFVFRELAHFNNLWLNPRCHSERFQFTSNEDQKRRRIQEW